MNFDNRTITVILPTYNRWGILQKCLEALALQSYPNNLWDLVVVDDGSSDGTVEKAPAFLTELQLSARFLRQEHKGRSAARNLGLRHAMGTDVLILADDIIATPDLIAEHVLCRKHYPGEAVVGFMTWWPQLEITSFMKCLEKGVILSFDSVRDKAQLDYHHAYSSNISLPRKIAKKVLFDETFTGYGFEDIEWGYRLQKAGVVFRFNRQALGYHNHPLTLSDYRTKMEEAGLALVRFNVIHSEIARPEVERTTVFRLIRLFIKASWRAFLLKLFSRWIKMGEAPVIDPCRCYQSIINYSFHRGIQKGRRKFLL